MDYGHEKMTDKEIVDKYHKILSENIGLNVRPKSYVAEMTDLLKHINKRSIDVYNMKYKA
jgi:hypothetical protein